MRLLSLPVIASILALCQAAPALAPETRAAAYSNYGSSGYLTVGDAWGYRSGVSVNKAGHLFFNALVPKPIIKAQFQTASAIKPGKDKNGPVYYGRILITSSGSNMCLTATGSGKGPVDVEVKKCKGSKKPDASQQWKSVGDPDGNRRYFWSGTSGKNNAYPVDLESNGAIIVVPSNNYVTLDCKKYCRPFQINKKIIPHPSK